MTQTADISVVLPGYNEADNIPAMIEQTCAAISPLGRSFEIIYVDDGSADASRECLEAAKAAHPELRVLYHKANFGQSAAIFSGINAARGDLVVTMDSDLQNDPADIPAMIECLRRENADAVCGVRRERQDSPMKRIAGRVANPVRHWALADGLSDSGCGFRVMRRATLVQLPAFQALHRFLPSILIIHGYRVVEMPICHRARAAGASKYGVGDRFWIGIKDLLGLRWYKQRFLPTERLRD